MEIGLSSTNDLSGYNITGSVQLDDLDPLDSNFFIYLDHSDRSGDVNSSELANTILNSDETRLSFGLGYILSEGANSSTYASLSYEDADTDEDTYDLEEREVVSGTSIRESGYGVAIGLRNNITDGLQIGVEVKYIDVGDLFDGVEFSSYLQFDVTESMDVRATIEFSDIDTNTDFGTAADTDTALRLGVHWAF